MSKLGIKEGMGWEVLTSDGTEMVVINPEICLPAIIKVRLVSFFGERQELHRVFRERVQIDATILTYCEENNFLNEWGCNNYICTDTEMKFQSFYYKVLDKFYVVIEMLTADDTVPAKFRGIVAGLIDSLDYSLVDEKNVIEVAGRKWELNTPPLFRYSKLSSTEKLVFLGDGKYLFVNVPDTGESLVDVVTEFARVSEYGIDNCTAVFDGAGNDGEVEWARYVSTTENGIISCGTYFRQSLGDGKNILSFVLERGDHSSCNVTSLLRFKEAV